MSNVIDLPSALLVKVPKGAINAHLDEVDPYLWVKLPTHYKVTPIPKGNYGTPFLARNPKDASQALWVHDIWTDNDLDLDTSTTLVIPKKQ